MDDTLARLTELVTSASWRVRHGTAKELEPIGITYTQARVLRIVASTPEPLRMADLADQLDVVPRSATSMIDALESVGLVDRQPDTSDRRSIRLTVTGAGRAHAPHAGAAGRGRGEELFGRLTAAEQREMHANVGTAARRSAQGTRTRAAMMHGPPGMRSMMRELECHVGEDPAGHGAPHDGLRAAPTRS